MKVAIIGFATEGRVSYDYFVRKGHEVTICDQNPTIAVPFDARTQLGEGYLANLHDYDLIVRSAGISPEVIIRQNPGVEPKITTAVNEFLDVCPTRHTIGVTGTKGKGTTSTLITKILEAAGMRVFLAGNIGRSPLEFVDQLRADDWVVLELSSYQLSDITHSPHTSVCLMVVPEHLDWHDGYDDYLGSKAHIFDYQAPEDTAIYYAPNEESRTLATHSPGLKIPYFAKPGATATNGTISIAGVDICRTDELKLLGEHNWQNVCAAVTTVWQFTQDVSAIRKVLTTFSGLPHRIEFVREVNGVKYYNDSYATGLHATKAAISAVKGNKIVVVGGYDRMLDLDHFPKFLAQQGSSVKKLLLIGASKERLAATLQHGGITNYVMSNAHTMPEVVHDAQALAEQGDSIVFSPGFASFDMFKDFETRGNLFREVVNSL